MLVVDLKQGRYEIVQFITKSCTSFGRVKSISVFLDSSPAALIEMSTPEQTNELAAKLGGTIVGATTTALIRLEQKPHRANVRQSP